MRELRTYFLLPLLAMICSSASSQISFEDRATGRGLALSYGDGLFGGGLSFIDIDGDGWDDLTFQSDDGENVRIFMNNSGAFTEVIPTPVTVACEGKQILWVDYDNDGDKDLFTTCRSLQQPMPTGQSRLFRNDGNWQLTDVTISSGLFMDFLPTFGASFGDVNKDGWLDLVILNRIGAIAPGDNMLFINNGNGTFTDMSISYGFQSDSTMSFCAGILDLDRDGWQDIYIAEDKKHVNKHYRNNGNGTLTEIGVLSGAGISIDAMSVTPGDYNNDGWLDIYVTNTQMGNALLQGTGNGMFTDVAAAAGVGYYSVGWGANFIDVDNDMDEDLYVSGTFPVIPNTQSVCYRNEGNGTFTDTASMGFAGDTTVSYSNAIGDVDNDGYPDIMVSNELPFDHQLWMTDTGPNNWMKVRLTGITSNRDGIGSYVEIYIGGFRMLRYTTCGTGYLGQNSLTQMFGTGMHTLVDSIVVTWPSGTVDRMYGFATNQVVDLLEGSTLISSEIVEPSPSAQWMVIEGSVLFIDQLIAGSVAITDALGRIVMKMDVNGQRSIDLSGLAPGIYRIQGFHQGQIFQTLSFAKDRH